MGSKTLIGHCHCSAGGEATGCWMRAGGPAHIQSPALSLITLKQENWTPREMWRTTSYGNGKVFLKTRLLVFYLTEIINGARLDWRFAVLQYKVGWFVFGSLWCSLGIYVGIYSVQFLPPSLPSTLFYKGILTAPKVVIVLPHKHLNNHQRPKTSTDLKLLNH